MKGWKNLIFQSASCHKTSVLSGTRHLTCWSLPSTIEKLSTRLRRPEDGVVDVWIVVAWVDISWAAAGCFGGESSSVFFHFRVKPLMLLASTFQFRYSRTLHCFSSETRRTLPWSSLQWTTLMRSSHCSLWIADTTFPSAHHLVLPKKLSIVTTVWQICLRCTGLQWVCI